MVNRYTIMHYQRPCGRVKRFHREKCPCPRAPGGRPKARVRANGRLFGKIGYSRPNVAAGLHAAKTARPPGRRTNARRKAGPANFRVCRHRKPPSETARIPLNGPRKPQERDKPLSWIYHPPGTPFAFAQGFPGHNTRNAGVAA